MKSNKPAPLLNSAVRAPARRLWDGREAIPTPTLDNKLMKGQLMADQKWLPYLEVKTAIDTTGNYKFHELSADGMAVGDCYMHGGALVKFYPDGTIKFQETTRTSSPTDLWHQRFLFRDANKNLLMRQVPFVPFIEVNIDGPEMNDQADHTWSGVATYPTWVYDQMVYIDWGAEC